MKLMKSLKMLKSWDVLGVKRQPFARRLAQSSRSGALNPCTTKAEWSRGFKLLQNHRVMVPVKRCIDQDVWESKDVSIKMSETLRDISCLWGIKSGWRSGRTASKPCSQLTSTKWCICIICCYCSKVSLVESWWILLTDLDQPYKSKIWFGLRTTTKARALSWLEPKKRLGEPISSCDVSVHQAPFRIHLGPLGFLYVSILFLLISR